MGQPPRSSATPRPRCTLAGRRAMAGRHASTCTLAGRRASSWAQSAIRLVGQPSAAPNARIELCRCGSVDFARLSALPARRRPAEGVHRASSVGFRVGERSVVLFRLDWGARQPRRSAFFPEGSGKIGVINWKLWDKLGAHPWASRWSREKPPFPGSVAATGAGCSSMSSSRPGAPQISTLWQGSGWSWLWSPAKEALR